MFNKIVTFRAFEARRIAPEPICAMHSNDNLPGFRRPAGGQRARPKLALACHWCLIGGRLECRWEVETPDGTRSPISTEPEAGRAFGRPVTPPRHDQLLWAAG